MSNFLYIMHERDWRFIALDRFDLRTAYQADMIIEFSDGAFRIHKNRFGCDGVTIKVKAPQAEDD